jgi:uncharacterized protein
MNEIKVPIKGMHCRSCEIAITENLQKIYGVKKAVVSQRNKEARIVVSRPVPHDKIASAIREAGYEVGTEKKPWISLDSADWRDVTVSIAIVMLILLVVTKTGLADMNTGSVASQGAIVALFVGLTAGLSTCMALVGGLVLGLSARHAEKHPEASAMERFRPHLFFNGGRIVSFVILGGLMGLFGSMFQLSGVTLGVLMILVGVVMFLLGLQLTSVFPRISGNGITLPSGLYRKLGLKKQTDSQYSHKSAVTLGALSFFLPCGFTQAMQLYAISTGSFTTGALVMGLFAVGTAPGLLGIGGLTAVVKGAVAQRFFKFAGVAVIVLAIINISNGYNLTGWQKNLDIIRPQFLSRSNSDQTAPTAPAVVDEKDVPPENVLKTTFKLPNDEVLVGFVGDIYPNNFNVKAGEAYTLEVDAKDDGVGCMSTIMIPGLVNQPQYLRAGTVHKLTFTAERPGVYNIACAMGVPFGKINVL